MTRKERLRQVFEPEKTINHSLTDIGLHGSVPRNAAWRWLTQQVPPRTLCPLSICNFNLGPLPNLTMHGLTRRVRKENSGSSAYLFTTWRRNLDKWLRWLTHVIKMSACILYKKMSEWWVGHLSTAPPTATPLEVTWYKHGNGTSHTIMSCLVLIGLVHPVEAKKRANSQQTWIKIAFHCIASLTALRITRAPYTKVH